MLTYFTVYFIVDSMMIVMSRLLLHAFVFVKRFDILDLDPVLRDWSNTRRTKTIGSKKQRLEFQNFYITYYCSSIKGIGSETTLKSHAVAFRTSSTVIFGAISISVNPVPFVLSTSNTQRSVIIRSTTL